MDVVQKESSTPETAFGKYGSFFALLNPNVCEYMPKGMSFTIEETKKGAEAVISVTPECPCFAVRNLDKVAHIDKLEFLNRGKEHQAVSKCADHAVFLFADGHWILHIFEFTKSQNTKRWKDVVNQFSGGVVRAYAVAGVLRIAEFSAVYLHFCYRKDKSNLVGQKPLPGKPAPKDNLKSPITLDSYPELPVQNQPVELNQDGYADIPLTRNG